MNATRKAAPWIKALLILKALLLASNVSAEPADPLANLRGSHPRLLVLDDELKGAKQLIQTDPIAAGAFERLRKEGDRMLTQASVKHVLVGPRLLQQSRSALQLISTTAGLYRLTGEVKYAERAKKELLTVAAFADWNPSHFLDVAEMCNACGIGYDWIYDQLSSDDRKVIRDALVKLAFKPALVEYEKHAFWTDANHNWAQVCAGGLTVGALAIADEEPELARKIIRLTQTTIMKPMRQFAPDGGWEEGPGYWSYATSYNVFYLAAIKSALGTDFGLESKPGFAQTGSFHIQMTGPTRKTFNFADAGEGLDGAPQLFWLAREFNRPGDAAWERSSSAGRMNIFHLLWFNPDGNLREADKSSPLDSVFKRVNVGAMRSTWDDANAWYIAFKGGDNGANHSHLDLGSFVLDAMGQRWGNDQGPDDYNLPGYFGQQRFTYFRLMTQAHNTLTFGKANQPTKAKAAIKAFSSRPGRSSVIIDLSAAYPAARSVSRGIAMVERKQVLIEDEIEADPDTQFEWNFHTPAKVDVDGRIATLTIGKTQLRARLLSPESAKFEAVPCEVPPPQKPIAGITNLFVVGKGTSRVTVLFSAVDDASIPPIVSLKQWDLH